MSETTPKTLPYEDEEELAVGSGQSTISKVIGTPENPDEVVKKKGLAAFEKMERVDGHYASVLQTRKLALLGKGYEIQPASDEPQHMEQAEFVRWNIDNMQGSFFQDLYELLDAEGKGFALSEIVWLYLKNGPYAGKVGLKQLKSKDQQYYGFSLDEFDNIHDDGIVQNPFLSHGMRMANTYTEKTLQTLQSSTIGGTHYNRRLPREKFVHFVFNGRAENPYGRGLGGVCYWYSWFKTEGGYKFWMVFLEQFGQPTVTVTTSKEIGEPDKRKLRSILKALQQETGIILPEGIELDLLEATRSGEAGYDKLIDKCNAEISKAVLGQTLTTEQGARGARSLGDVHQEVLHDLLMFDADLLEATINEQLIRRLVDYNYAVDAYPRFIIPLKQRRALEAFSRSLERLVKVGARIPERYVHDETGIPIAEEGEPILAITSSAPTLDMGSAESFSERPIPRSQLEPATFRRQQLEAQDALLEDGVSRARLIVDQILTDLIGQVRRGKFIEQGIYNPDLKIDIRPLRQQLIATSLQAHLTGWALGVDELAMKGVEFAPERFEAFAEGDEEEILKPEEVMDLFKGRVPINQRSYRTLLQRTRAKYFTIAGIEETSLLQIAQEALLEAIENSGTAESFATAVRERGIKYTGRAFGQDLAGEALKDHHIRLIFRNNIQSAYHEARRQLFEDPDVVEQVPYWMYSAIDDDRVRPHHLAMDGRIYRRDDAIWATWYPPNGHNCRCGVVPITVFEARRLRAEQIVTGPPVVEGQAAMPDIGFGRVAA